MRRKKKFFCACGHSLAFHNPEDNKCHRLVRVPETHRDEPDHVGMAAFNRTVSYVDVDCQCQQYVGNKPQDHNVRELA